MGRKPTNVVASNDAAIRKRIKDTAGQPQAEWRIDGEQGLVLITQPTGAGVFYLFYRNAHGKQRKLRLGEYGPTDGLLSLASAKAMAAERRAEVVKGDDPAHELASVKSSLTFKALAEKFLAENSDLAESTKQVYGYSLAADAYPIIGDVPATSVTADHIYTICKRIEATGARVQSDRTKSAIGGVYKWAIKQRLAKANPCKDIGRRSTKVARARTPSAAEIGKIWTATGGGSAGLSLSMRLIVRLAIVTGQRRTEVCGARVSELSLDGDKATWTIPGDTNRRGKIIEGRTKNGREQVLPLSSLAVSLFREALETCADNECLFPANLAAVKKGTTPRTPHINGDSVTRAMSRLREDHGIDDLGIHDMRRAISNWLKDEGVSKEVRDLVLNHLDPSVDGEHYSSSARMEKQVRHAMEAWAGHVARITGQAAAAENVVNYKSA